MSFAKQLWTAALIGGMTALAHEEPDRAEAGESGPEDVLVEDVLIEHAGGPGGQVEIERREFRGDDSDEGGPRFKAKREIRRDGNVLRFHADNGEKVEGEIHIKKLPGKSDHDRGPRKVKRFPFRPDGEGDVLRFRSEGEEGGEKEIILKRFPKGPDFNFKWEPGVKWEQPLFGKELRVKPGHWERDIIIRRPDGVKELRFDFRKPFGPLALKGSEDLFGSGGDVHHLKEAIRHLHAAGLHEPAKKVEEELERRQSSEGRHKEIRAELDRMRGELEKTKRELKRLLKEESEECSGKDDEERPGRKDDRR